MKYRMIGLFILATAICAGLPVAAQAPGGGETTTAEKNGEKDPSKLWVDLSGVMYLEWAYNSGFKYTGSGSWGKIPRWGIAVDYAKNPVEVAGSLPTNYPSKNNHTFRMQRAYITLRKELGDYFSVRVTTDIDPQGSDYVFLKLGYVQFFKKFGTPMGSIDLKAQLGKIGTLVVGVTDLLSDLRWLGPNYMNNSKLVLNGNSFDDSADLGGMVSLGILDLVRLEYSFTNGEGYKADDNETYGGKAHTLMVSINPVEYLKEVHLNFYGRWEDTNKNKLDLTPWEVDPTASPIKYSGVDKRNYLGFGIAWKTDLLKAGLNFFAPEKHYSKTSFIDPRFTPDVFINPLTGYSPRYRQKFLLIDSWIHLNLGAITPAGVLVAGRCAYGKELKSMLANQRQTRETLLMGGGVGYQFNRYFRMMLYYETIIFKMAAKLPDSSRRNPTPNNNVYLKLEAKY